MNYLLNINFDDVHPEGSKHIEDCGGDLERGVFKYILDLLEEFPELKFTFFVTPNWIDKPNDPQMIKQIKRVFGIRYTNTWSDEPFRLDKHIAWCEWINEFVRKGNIEVAVHGLYHHRDSDPRSAEFKDLPYEICKQRLMLAETIFRDTGLMYVKGFRPPGWGISEGLFRALKEMDYLYVALDPIACNIPFDELPRYEISIYKGLRNIPQSWDIKNGRIAEAIEILKKYGLISAKGHIQDRYGRDYLGNGLTEESYKNIRGLLIRLEELSIKVKFATMGEIADEYKSW